MKKLLMVVNAPEFFLSHRLSVAIAARKEGYDVHIATGPGIECQTIRQYGFKHHLIPFTRSGTNVFREIFCFWALWRLFRKICPVIVHLVTIKPVLYGGIVARLAAVPALVVAISGLGSTFVVENARSKLFLKLIEFFYRVALRHVNLRVIFQNTSDQDSLVNMKAVRRDQCVLIKGSGVCLETFVPRQSKKDSPVIMMACRLLRQKGVFEFAEAARIISKQGLEAEFWLVGKPDPGNPSSVPPDILEGWEEEGCLKILGFRSDVEHLIIQADILVLPSYYGEGLPKVLMEAAAAGKAVITTDRPGCRDAIIPGQTGLLVPPKDSIALSTAIKQLLTDTSFRYSLGIEGRRLAEREFGIDRVVDAHLAVYEGVLSRC